MFDATQSAYVDFRAIAKERTTPLVAWIGSGLSVPAGAPTWLALRDRLLKALRAKANAITDDAEFLRNKASAAEAAADLWVSFEIIKKSLGQASYRDTVREALLPATTARIPNAYSDLWRLGVSGVLNLNLDRLATRAFTDAYPGTAPLEFNGDQAALAAHVLKNPRPFLVNLHGVVDDAATWILTRPELSRLMGTPGYQELIVSCLATRTVLFLGVTADDVAVGGHLERLAHLKIDTGSHFWLTDRRDRVTDTWAEKVGIRVIRYEADATHSAVAEFFRDLLTYVPREPVAPPVSLQDETIVVDRVPAPDELVGRDAEYIRQVLNAKAAEILAQPSQTAYEDYERFSEEYDEAVYRAWYVSARSPRNKLLGFELLEEIGSGTFGTVYRARSPHGEQVAVKILNEQVRRDRDMLQSFRRGVRSMRLLSKAGVEGMVPYREASEIPAFVVMEWIDGPTLRNAVDARHFATWADVLRVSCELSTILRRAHSLPDRVLHRDVRPDNIMLENYYTVPDEWRVVMLDFDLSWHIGAVEKSFIHRAQTTGYLAPEQMQPIEGVSTRSAAVDSFGLGMTLYFLVSGNDPLPVEHRHANWSATVTNACLHRDRPSWASLPHRFARLILNCTRDRQSERWDMAQIDGELRRLNELLTEPRSELGSDLVAEELAARVRMGQGYVWNNDTAGADLALASGLRLRIRADEPRSSVALDVEWSGGGTEPRKQVGRWLPDATRAASAYLRAAGWRIEDTARYGQTVHLTATAADDKLLKDMAGAAEVVDKVAAKLSFK